MAERNRLLAERRGDPAWLAGLEDSMARHAVAVAAARRALVARLNAALRRGRRRTRSRPPGWRCSTRSPTGWRGEPALAVEDGCGPRWRPRGRGDAAAGGAALGAHRADLAMADADRAARRGGQHRAAEGDADRAWCWATPP